MKKDISLEKETIMNVAATLFGEKGYAATSVRDIARDLDVSIATIYYYFRNKEGLLFTIIDSIGNDLYGLLKKSIEEFSDPLERLRHMLLGHICLAHQKKNEVKVYVEEQVNLSKKYRSIIYKQHRNIYDTYINQLEELKKLKLVRFEQLPVAAFAMFGMANWCYRWFKEDGGIPIEEAAQILADIFFHGILNPGVSSPSVLKERSSSAKK